MRSRRRLTLAAPPPDPFGEHERMAYRSRLCLLGAAFEFETNSQQLLRMIRNAYEGLPAHRSSLGGDRRFRMSLIATPGGPADRRRSELPPVRGLARVGLV